MLWFEALGPLKIEISAQAQDSDYSVIVHTASLSTSRILIDAHWGHEAASRIALDLLYRAWKDKKRFLAEERMEARQMPPNRKELHIKWASLISDDAERLGDLLEEAVRAAQEILIPVVNIQARMESFYEIMEIGWEMAIQSLIASGMTLEEAQKEFTERSLHEFSNQWRLVPSRRFPQTGSWVPG